MGRIEARVGGRFFPMSVLLIGCVDTTVGLGYVAFFMKERTGLAFTNKKAASSERANIYGDWFVH